MANEEHLSILKQGVARWNVWRHYTDEKPDLRGADLQGVDLQGVDLSEAEMRGAKLHEANLRRANLSMADLVRANLYRTDLLEAELFAAGLIFANLRGADLRDANLRGAKLRDTDLQEADLRGTDLSDAHLQGANLRRVPLHGTSLQETRLGHTVFFQTEFKDTEGLDTCLHSSPSNLDHFTIAEADPALPLSFLRGCGLPDLIIDNVEALRGDAIQFYSCFISYSTENEEFAQRLYADLQNEGVRCYLASNDLEGGKKMHRQINEAIRQHDKLLLILSEASMESNWVEHEVRQARERERDEDRRVLFPIRLEPFESIEDWTLFDADEGRDLAREVREYFIPDFSDWKDDHDAYKGAFDRLLSDLQAAD